MVEIQNITVSLANMLVVSNKLNMHVPHNTEIQFSRFPTRKIKNYIYLTKIYRKMLRGALLIITKKTLKQPICCSLGE